MADVLRRAAAAASSHHNDEDTDEDDPVVEEYTVFKSNSLAGGLHLLQFPLRTRASPYIATQRRLFVTEPVSASSSAVPPSSSVTRTGAGASDKVLPSQSSRFVLESMLDVSASDSFRPAPSGGRGGVGSLDLLEGDEPQTANKPEDSSFDDPILGGDAAADGGESTNSGTYSYVLESLPSVLSASYAVALLIGKEVHLTPLTSVQQLVPRLPSATPVASLRSTLASDAAGAAPATGAVQAHLERQLQRLRSVVLHANMRTAKRAELYETSSVESSAIMQRLIAPTHISSSPSTATVPDSRRPPPLSAMVAGGGGGAAASAPLGPLPDPLSHLFPLEFCGARDESFQLARPTLLRYVGLTHSIFEQVLHLVNSAKVLTHRSLVTAVRPRHQSGPANAMTTAALTAELDKVLVAHLRVCAVLVHGVWVSGRDGTFRGTGGTLREYVLCQLALGGPEGLPTEVLHQPIKGHTFYERTVREVLESVAVLDTATRRWRIALGDGLFNWTHTNASGGGAAGESRQPAPNAVADDDDDAPPAASTTVAEEEWMKSFHADEVAAQRLEWQRRSDAILRHVEAIVRNGRPLPDSQLTLPWPRQGVARPPEPHFSPAARGGGAGGGGGGGGVSSPTKASSVDMAAAIQQAEQYVKAIYRVHSVVNKEVLANFLKASVRNPRSAIYGLPEVALQQAVNRHLAKLSESAYVQLARFGDGKEPREIMRRMIIMAVRTQSTFSAKDIQEKALRDHQLGGTAAPVEQIPEETLQTVLKELAEYRTSEKLWHRRTGMADLNLSIPGLLSKP